MPADNGWEVGYTQERTWPAIKLRTFLNHYEAQPPKQGFRGREDKYAVKPKADSLKIELSWMKTFTFPLLTLNPRLEVV